MSGWRGVFGKTPATGDFVTRGLPPAVRRALDLCLARDIGRREDWPEGGLRGLIAVADGLALFVAVPSEDSAGRGFPLAAATEGRGLSYEAAEQWCAAVLPALAAAAAGETDPDTVMAALDTLPDPPRDAADGEPAFWTAGGPPGEPSPETLDAIFSSG